MESKKLLTFILTMVFIGISILANAQYDPEAKKILDKVSKKYKSLKSFKVDFEYSLHSPKTNVNENFTGKILVKGSKYILEMGKQKIINNGNTVWTYLKDANEVNVSDYNPDKEEITPTNIYTIYKDGFKYVVNETKSKEASSNQKVVDLIPKDKSKPFFKIRLTINKNNYTIKRWKIFEKSGNRYTYKINNFHADVKLSNKKFKFDKSKHKGVEVIDLR